jgi:pyruvate dehydrogenase E2 component (dihydrolipoamide acetyltransferase)
MAETINMPKLGFDMAEGVLVRWVKKEGEAINKGDVLAEIETDKATVEVESSAAGTVLSLLVNEGDVVPVSAPIAVIGEAGEKVDAPAAVAAQPAPAASQPQADVQASAPAAAPVAQAPAPAESGPIKASPLAKKIARDKGVSLGAVQGTGPGGRIVRRDIEAALAAKPQSETPKSIPAPVQAAPVFQAVSAADETVKLTKLRQAIGRRLVESKQNYPHFYVSHEYKMEALMDLRKQINAYLPDGEKISVNDFILKAAALTLRQFPNLNAILSGDSIVRRGQINVGVAVTIEGGLMTVVVKDADQKPLRQISSEVKSMAARAREGKVKPEDVDGSTFSTSNLGMYDVENFIAIINPPEAAILAIGSAREVPVVEGGVIKPGWRMKATISVDHRVSDGAEAAQFMQALAGFLENPVRMLV